MIRQFLLLILLIGTGIIFAEVYTIRNVNYEIDGYTRESVLNHYLDIKSGTTFSDKIELSKYIEEKKQDIYNQRTLSGGDILPSFTKDDSIVYVDLTVKVKDTWNYMVLPYPQYDSNTGITLGFRAKNYNFLGGMETLSLDFDYLKLDEGGTEYYIGSDFKVPFYFYGFEWAWSFAENMVISPEAAFKNNTNTGLSVNIPLGGINLLVSANQDYFLNQDGEDDADGYFLKTSGRIGTEFHFGDITYTPAAITSYPYKLSGDLSLARKGYKLGAEHSFSYGKINWIGNFRDGFKTTFIQDLQYNFTRELWVNTQKVEVQYHKSFGFVGSSSRFVAFYDYNAATEDDSIGEYVRGIRNDRLVGNSAIIINQEVPFHLPLGPLDRWFDAQASAFFDYALVKPLNGSFDITKGWYGTGIEGIAFLNASRSVYMRGSFGVDLEAIIQGTGITGSAKRDGSDVWELKIAVGHHY